MFREMRRNAQSLSNKECEEILKNATAGVLSVHGDDGYPYSVPLSYVYADGKIYFHSALTGHKIDAINKHEKVSFCVIAKDDVAPEEFTTHYKSVIIFGKAKIVEDKDETKRTITVLAEKYSHEHMVRANAEINKYNGKFCMVEICVDSMTGKQAKELI